MAARPSRLRALEFAGNAGIHRLVAALRPWVQRPAFPMTAFVLAFAATASMTIPVVPLLISLVSLRRDRWLQLAFWAVLGSTVAATALTALAAQFAMPWIHARLPQLAQSPHWHYVVDWTARFGFLAVAAVAASPFAQTPVLLLAAMLGMTWPAMALGLALGKAVKYGVMARMAAKAGDGVATYFTFGDARQSHNPPP